MEFGEKLQNLRKASNLSQEQLADMLGVSRQSVSKWESGVTYPEMDKLIAMAKLFKCSMDDLVNNEVKDEEIVTTKNTENEGYIDSLLNFVVDTVNMFFSMKFPTLIKSLFEIFIIGFVLFGGATGITAILFNFVDSLDISGDWGIFAFLILLIFFAIVIGSFLFAIIAFFQIFKIRYLDYYRKAVYEQAQVRDLKLEINKKEIEIDNDADKKEFKKVKEPVVILRDPKGTNLEFLEVISKFVRTVIDIILIIVSLVVLLPISILLIVTLVISAYLISVHLLFIGSTLAVLGATVVCYILYELLFDYVTVRKPAASRLAIMFAVSLVVASAGVGISLISFKDIKLVEQENQLSVLSDNFEFDDDLTIASDVGRVFTFIIDDNLDDVKVSVEYSAADTSVSLVDRGSVKYIDFDFQYYSTYNELKLIVENLKNNEYYTDSFNHYVTVKVFANKDNIKKLINNLADRNLIYTIATNEGYISEIEDIKNDKDICNYDSEGIKRCYRIYAADECKISVNNEGKVVIGNDKCSCGVDRDVYHCYLYD